MKVRCCIPHNKKSELFTNGKDYKVLKIENSLKAGDQWYTIETNVKDCVKKICWPSDKLFMYYCIEYKGPGNPEYFARFSEH